MKKLALVLLAISCARFDKAAATVMLAPGTNLPGQVYIDNGARFANSTVAIRRVSNTTGSVSYGSGVLLEDGRHVVTAAHVVDSTSGLRRVGGLSVVTGLNYLSPDNSRNVARYAVHRTYAVGSGLGTGSAVDICIIELSQPIFGLGLPIANLNLPNGVVLDFAGYGQHGLSEESLQAKDGYLRAFQSLSINPSGIFSDAIYNTGTAVGLPNNQFLGFGASGDSGGGVYYNGKLVGIIVAGSTARTTYVDLTNQETLSFINDFKAFSATGSRGFQLSSIAVIPATATNGPRVSGRIDGGPGDKAARIEVSLDMGRTSQWFPIGTVPLDNAGSGEFTSIPDDRPSSAGTSRYFLRIAADP